MTLSPQRALARFAAAVSIAAYCLVLTASAQVSAPSTWSTELQVQGEDPGTEFDDWVAAGIPVAATDPADNLPALDFNEVQIANDADNIYIRATFHNTENVSISDLYLAFDTDQNVATGFDIFGLGVIGSEVGYQSDFPFEQSAELFNTGIDGVDIYGGDFIGLALTFPFWDGAPPSIAGTQVEYAIPIDLAIGPDPPGTLVFTSDSFNFMFWTEIGPSGDVTDVISYTLAESPDVPGDFDGDGDVDGDDFLVWQLGFGTIYDGDDFLTWQQNYPTPGGGNGSNAVPEPTCLILAVLGLCLAAVWRR